MIELALAVLIWTVAIVIGIAAICALLVFVLFFLEEF